MDMKPLKLWQIKLAKREGLQKLSPEQLRAKLSSERRRELEDRAAAYYSSVPFERTEPGPDLLVIKAKPLYPKK